MLPAGVSLSESSRFDDGVFKVQMLIYNKVNFKLGSAGRQVKYTFTKPTVEAYLMLDTKLHSLEFC
jgi:hypothetical protein